MNWDEYNKLFHELELNRVAFKQLMDCDQEVLKLVNAAIAAERESCAHMILSQNRGDTPRLYRDTLKLCAMLIKRRNEKV